MPRSSYTLKLYIARLFLCYQMLLFSGTLVGLTGARLRYTMHLPPTDPLNHGQPFYDKIVAELFATSVLTFFWTIYEIHEIVKGVKHGGFWRWIIFEVVFGWCLWILYLVGAAFATKLWGNLSFCWQFHACRLLTALVAFAWIGWITFTVLGIVTVISMFNKRC